MTPDKKFNTCLWVPRYWPAMGGTELHTHELAKYLSSDFDVNVITHCVSSETAGVNLEKDVISANDAVYAEGDVRVNRLSMSGVATPLFEFVANKHSKHRVSRPLYSGLFYTNLQARSSVITQRCSLIHFVYNGLTDSGVLAARNALKWKIPFILTPNILDTSDRDHAWNSTRFKSLYRAAQQIIALTDHESEWLQRQGVPEHKISVVPYGPILETGNTENKFRKTIGVGSDNVVLFLGRINESKGYDVLLKACHILWLSHPETRVVFMGPATEEARRRITEFSDSRIVLWEEFDQSMKADALNACDVVCVPSRMESLGVVYIEAAFSSKPVVALDLPVLREVIKHQSTGLLVDDCANSVADALVRLLDNPTQAKAMGGKAHSFATRRFNWAGVRDNIGEIYRNAITSKSRCK